MPEIIIIKKIDILCMHVRYYSNSFIGQNNHDIEQSRACRNWSQFVQL